MLSIDSSLDVSNGRIEVYQEIYNEYTEGLIEDRGVKTCRIEHIASNGYSTRLQSLDAEYPKFTHRVDLDTLNAVSLSLEQMAEAASQTLFEGINKIIDEGFEIELNYDITEEEEREVREEFQYKESIRLFAEETLRSIQIPKELPKELQHKYSYRSTVTPLACTQCSRKIRRLCPVLTNSLLKMQENLA